jgi:polyribonucleotide nucleotidyltransferase
MKATLAAARPELSPWAPRIVTIKIPVDKIRDVIGPGGKVIRAIIEQTGATIDVEDDGTANIASANGESNKKALEMIMSIIQEAEVGKVYKGVVQRIMDFGAIVEIFPGTSGLLHVSQLDYRRVENVRDVVKEGDELEVKCIGVDRDSGKISLSRKAMLPAPEGYVEREDRIPPSRGGGGGYDRGPRGPRGGGDRGGGNRG